MFLLRIKKGGDGETKTMLGRRRLWMGKRDFFQLEGLGEVSRLLGRLGTKGSLHRDSGNSKAQRLT